MAQSSRTFRIFVSSTFSDLKAERNALQEKVFPRLRNLAAARACRFQVIDLRWGVSEEASLDQQTMKICLGEIERCQKTSPRPNFIVLLGDRYGWRPLPSEIPTDEFEQILPLVAKEDKDLLKQWYRRDDNAIPPTYCLQPRSGEFVEYEHWEKVETRLRQVFLSAIQKLSLSPDAALKYTASATEQEIVTGALKVQDASEHVFCFLRDIQGLPDDSKAVNFRETDIEAAHKQAALKARLKQQLPGNIHEYTAQWQGDGPSLEHLDQLCDNVYAALAKVIRAEVGRLEAAEPLEREVAAHAAFGVERGRVFIGRMDLLKAIGNYIAGSDLHPLAIGGASGSGKSALMAKAVEQAQKNGPDVLYRFVGATPESSNGRALLESLCRQISRRYGANESTIPSEYKDLVQEFPTRLALAKPGKPLILFLDALDQLSDTDHARSLTWLPADLPPNVRLIVSTLPGECLQALESKLPAQSSLEVQPMSVEDGKAILSAWLDGVHRKLQDQQEQYLLGRFKDCGLPLYLKLAFEEALLWKSYDALPELSGDISGILRDLFKRLSQPSNHGSMLVSHSLGYLAAAKNGLSEDELLDVLSLDNEVLVDFHRRSPKSPEVERLPVVIWSRLYFDLEPYLTERSADGASLLAFYHRQLSEAVQAQYLSGENKLKRHKVLANYFYEKPFLIEGMTGKAPHLRKLSEQPYQLLYGEMSNELLMTLTDYRFLEAKAKAYSIYSLIEDYERSLGPDSHLHLSSEDEESIRLIRGTLRLSAFALSKDKHQIAGQLIGRLIGSENPRVKTLLEQASTKHDEPWLRPLTNSLKSPGGSEESVLGGNRQGITGVAITPNNQRIVSISAVGEIKTWDFSTGQEERVLTKGTGSTGYFHTLAITPDGQRVVYGSVGIIQIQNLNTGLQEKGFQDYFRWRFNFSGPGEQETQSEKVSVHDGSGDHRRVITGDKDGYVKLWDMNQGKVERVLTKQPHAIIAVAITRSGQRAVSLSSDGDLAVWNLTTGESELKLKVKVDNIKEFVCTRDGKYIICLVENQSANIWDMSTGKMHFIKHNSDISSLYIHKQGQHIYFNLGDPTSKWLNILTGQEEKPTNISGSDFDDSSSWVNVVGQRTFNTVASKEECILQNWQAAIDFLFITPDGQHLMAGSNFGQINTWNLTTGVKENSFLACSDYYCRYAPVAITPDGQCLVTVSDGSTDKTINVWDLITGKLSLTLKTDYLDSDHRTIISPNGQQLIAIEKKESRNTLRVWNLQTGLEEQSVEVVSGDLKIRAALPDGQHLILTDRNVIRILNILTGKVERSLAGHSGMINSLVVTPDGHRAISASDDQTIRLWNLTSNKEESVAKGHSTRINKIAITADGSYALSAALDGTLKSWNLSNFEEVRVLQYAQGAEWILELTKEKRAIFAIVGHLMMWNILTDEVQKLHGATGPGHYEIHAIAITPDEKYIVASTEKGLKLWNQNGILEARTFPFQPENTANIFMSQLKITSDGLHLLAAVPNDHSIWIWDLSSGVQERVIRNISGYPFRITLTPDNQHIICYVSGHDFGTTKMWNLSTGQEEETIKVGGIVLPDMAITDDGEHFISSNYTEILIWNMNTGEKYGIKEAHSERINAIAVIPKSKSIITVSDDHTIKVWDIVDKSCIATFQVENHVSACDIAPDGQTIMVGDSLGKIHFLHLETS